MSGLADDSQPTRFVLAMLIARYPEWPSWCKSNFPSVALDLQFWVLSVIEPTNWILSDTPAATRSFHSRDRQQVISVMLSPRGTEGHLGQLSTCGGLLALGDVLIFSLVWHRTKLERQASANKKCILNSNIMVNLVSDGNEKLDQIRSSPKYFQVTRNSKRTRARQLRLYFLLRPTLHSASHCWFEPQWQYYWIFTVSVFWYWASFSWVRIPFYRWPSTYASNKSSNYLGILPIHCGGKWWCGEVGVQLREDAGSTSHQPEILWNFFSALFAAPNFGPRRTWLMLD